MVALKFPYRICFLLNFCICVTKEKRLHSCYDFSWKTKNRYICSSVLRHNKRLRTVRTPKLYLGRKSQQPINFAYCFLRKYLPVSKSFLTINTLNNYSNIFMFSTCPLVNFLMSNRGWNIPVSQSKIEKSQWFKDIGQTETAIQRCSQNYKTILRNIWSKNSPEQIMEVIIWCKTVGLLPVIWLRN